MKGALPGEWGKAELRGDSTLRNCPDLRRGGGEGAGGGGKGLLAHLDWQTGMGEPVVLATGEAPRNLCIVGVGKRRRYGISWFL